MPDASQNPVAPPPTRPGWQRNLPNALTLARVAMTAAFVAVLSIYRFPDTNSWALPVGLVLFIVAALTDAVDGYLARRWQVVSVFGRIMDPFADKVLILGAFVMLAGPGFRVDVSAIPMDILYSFARQTTGVASWMVIVILGRELLVTTIRAVLEGMGVDFSASLTGKLKMIAQSVGVPVILILAWLTMNAIAKGMRANAAFDQVHPQSSPLDEIEKSFTTAHLCSMAAFVLACLVTLITALSAIPYITRAIAALKDPRAS